MEHCQSFGPFVHAKEKFVAQVQFPRWTPKCVNRNNLHLQRGAKLPTLEQTNSSKLQFGSVKPHLQSSIFKSPQKGGTGQSTNSFTWYELCWQIEKIRSSSIFNRWIVTKRRDRSDYQHFHMLSIVLAKWENSFPFNRQSLNRHKKEGQRSPSIVNRWIVTKRRDRSDYQHFHISTPVPQCHCTK